MKKKELELLYSAGNLIQELEDGELDSYISGQSEIRKKKKSYSQKTGNDGKHCTATWECSICPTHTCWC
ncbi:plantaricin C family lantibiotic [Staphylococcus capitis]|jgi:hypothetical protein|uniref:plantaricin C family lantibiotic n=1 Tax=Staphylococcus TaxID=1279 RepID=UPI000CCB80D4|nr:MULTISPECIES: plantaricin C family lantibiotic [Staphylococcus]MBN6854217.1 plantaricin C family lantibiotic [Staphylococcus warneri]MCC9117614.1 plantaricin C family lantibiotic [Staphylococcus capitis]MCC9143925.1 plantaricin C family lantibiotic [Staphylococcus capitis]PMB94518.1 plantaricin C family lantibiotic [Staphylococcus sp. UMB0328]